ncbi:MAG: GspMb/PilO family protein [Paracoccaceae bacterium]
MKLLRGLVVLLVLAGVCLGAAWFVLNSTKSQLEHAKAEAATLERNIADLSARVTGLQAPADTAASDLPQEFFILAANDLDAELALQDAILNVIASQNVTPISFGPTTVSVDAEMQVVAFEVEFETSYDATVEIIAALEQYRPVMSLDNIWLRAVPLSSRPDKDTPVYVRLAAWSYWVPERADEEG